MWLCVRNCTGCRDGGAAYIWNRQMTASQSKHIQNRPHFTSPKVHWLREFWPIRGPNWPQKLGLSGDKNWPTGAILHTHIKGTYNMRANHVLGSGIKTLFEKKIFHSSNVMAIVKVLGHIGECDISVGVFVNTVSHSSLFLLIQFSCGYHFLSHNLIRLYRYEKKRENCWATELGPHANCQIQITTTH